MGTVYVLQEDGDHHIMYNDVGGALAQHDMAVIGSLPCVADNAIAAAAYGSFHTASGLLEIRTDELKTGEDIFATPNQLVYFDQDNAQFSDTAQDGYYIVGQLKFVRGTNDYITFIKFPLTELVTT